jgi:ferredoxin
MGTEIYYFSGTGNSYHLAKELNKNIKGSKLIPIVSLLNQDKIIVNGTSVGIVFPLHGLTISKPVRLFLKKADFSNTDYIFGVATRGGSRCLAFDKIKKLLKRNNKSLDASFILTLLNNDPKLIEYEDPTEEDISKMEKTIQNRVDQISEIVTNKKNHHDEDTNYADFPFSKPVNYLLERLVLFGMFYTSISKINNYFYTDSKCTGCGICQKVCLSEKVKLVDKKPVWQNDVHCYMCYTCLNYCPEQAIQIKDKIYMKSYTPQKGRYPHPYATVKEISQQKFHNFQIDKD